MPIIIIILGMADYQLLMLQHLVEGGGRWVVVELTLLIGDGLLVMVD